MARRSFLTCRHGFERYLSMELQSVHKQTALPYAFPGLVQIINNNYTAPSPSVLPDCAFALQSLPNCDTIKGTSVKDIAKSCVHSILPSLDAIHASNPSALDTRPPWVVHAITPGALKGQPKPQSARRTQLIADTINEELKTIRRRVYKATEEKFKPFEKFEIPTNSLLPSSSSFPPPAAAIIQLLLLNPEETLISCAEVLPAVPSVGFELGSWPYSAPYAAGLYPVPDFDASPNSAYRKLVEALAMCSWVPNKKDKVIDLGASPGGFTAVWKSFGCSSITAVDRSELTPPLMSSKSIKFVKGDAFNYKPEEAVGGKPVADYMSADIASYPSRAVELIGKWCSNQWADKMIVQMKFTGDPDWKCMGEAMKAATEHGYAVRIKHPFNCKNEAMILTKRIIKP